MNRELLEERKEREARRTPSARIHAPKGHIDLSEQTSVESREISEGVVADYDAAGNLVGIDIDNASAKVDIHKLSVSKLPAPVETLAG